MKEKGKKSTFDDLWIIWEASQMWILKEIRKVVEYILKICAKQDSLLEFEIEKLES